MANRGWVFPKGVFGGIVMATLTKKDLIEAIEDMPMDAEVEFYHYNIGYAKVYKAHYNEELNKIELC
jgi:hypothetical protein